MCDQREHCKQGHGQQDEYKIGHAVQRLPAIGGRKGS
jgi:hypothetical protein